jgi:hypothetical protein
MNRIRQIKPKKAWLLKVLPILIWVSITVVKLSLGMADPDFPPFPPPAGGNG